MDSFFKFWKVNSAQISNNLLYRLKKCRAGKKKKKIITVPSNLCCEIFQIPSLPHFPQKICLLYVQISFHWDFLPDQKDLLQTFCKTCLLNYKDHEKNDLVCRHVLFLWLNIKHFIKQKNLNEICLLLDKYSDFRRAHYY